MNEGPDPQTDAPEEERVQWKVLAQLEGWLERPMLILSFIWLGRSAPASPTMLTRVGGQQCG